MGAARAAGTARVVLVLAALIALAGLGAGSAAADGNINAKHFFWAPGQSPQGTVDSVANNIIYHGGNAGPGAIGIQKKPAVYSTGVRSGPTASARSTPTVRPTRARPCRTT